MKRTTVMLPDDMAARLRYEARRRGTSTAQLVREAVEQHFPPRERAGWLSFFAIGEGTSPDDSERVDEIVLEAITKKRGR